MIILFKTLWSIAKASTGQLQSHGFNPTDGRFQK